MPYADPSVQHAYDRYRSMMARCFNPRSKSYPDYGGRGITVCDEWRLDFHAYRAYIGEPPFLGATVDRINNDGIYEPGNVRWATRSEQTFNQRHACRLKTHCVHDHPFNEINTRVTAAGKRACRSCERERSTARRTAA